ncbi:MAG: hypothetical protein NE334_07120 [Lentisphaeraceae bacterium]|nr:hypothetical protein [Lentisphaeraceae bacterium]
MFRYSMLFLLFCQVSVFSQNQAALKSKIQSTKGLIAFWDFEKNTDGLWDSYFDKDTGAVSYPVYLRSIGDDQRYLPSTWSKGGKAKLLYDKTGPLGKAVKFNKGYIFAEVPRDKFDETPLDIYGYKPFTMISWVKFVGKRHFVSGIWDEGGWDKYGGRRQYAIFGGLFGSKGVIGHISATGASSFPQSTKRGSQYARIHSANGMSFKNNEWVATAISYDPVKKEIMTYQDGLFASKKIKDGIIEDVYSYGKKIEANPYKFTLPIYSPKAFILKFNGYDYKKAVKEHRVQIDLRAKTIEYDRDGESKLDFEYDFEVLRTGKSLSAKPLVFKCVKNLKNKFDYDVKPGDVLRVSFYSKADGKRSKIGKTINYNIREGAPFTFGRALGLGGEEVDHGTQLFIDGVAVFNRVLSPEEMKQLAK